jgi:hypothetical protein
MYQVFLHSLGQERTEGLTTSTVRSPANAAVQQFSNGKLGLPG